MTFGSLFAGIGGFDLGLERAGMTCRWQVEIDPFCQKVLAKHWPNMKRYGDIKQLDPKELEPVDLICGGFPCQPFSQAGKRKGKKDDRYLWPEMLRIITQKRPAWVFCENVAGIIGLALDGVLLDLENQGYATRAFIIPACAVDAKHRRDRVWIVGHAEFVRELQPQRSIENKRRWARNSSEDVADGNGQQVGRLTEPRRQCCEWLPEPDVGRVAHGIPNRVDRLKGLGNAVVPQVVEIIGRAIMEAHALRR